jgi:hypothetical protein
VNLQEIIVVNAKLYMSAMASNGVLLILLIDLLNGITNIKYKMVFLQR